MFINAPGRAVMSDTILRLPAVQAQTGNSRSTIYLRIEQRLWPKPVKIGARAVGWPANEVATLNAARIAAMSDDDIRELVTKIEAARSRTIRWAG
jgi:prophage regulatory protein